MGKSTFDAGELLYIAIGIAVSAVLIAASGYFVFEALK